MKGKSRKKNFIGKGLPILLLLIFLPLKAGATDYYVASSGSDTNDGSVVTPWKTITYALQQATTGDAIHVATGTYSTLTGESFPLNMTEGVSLLGASRETTILDGGSTATVVSAKGISEGTLTGFTITNGSATQGGGIYVVNSGISITDNIISQNSAGAGGGIYAAEGAASISANQITENQAYMYGGGLYLADFSGTVERNVILNNQATRGSGGGIYVVNFSGKLNNNLVAKNTASSVGGVYAANFDDTSKIINNTIADNSATLSDSVGGMQTSGVSSVLKNNIFWNNNNGDEDDDLYGGLVAIDNTLGTVDQESIGISYSIIENYVGQNNNIYEDPQFVDSINNNYHLSVGSPAIDVGTTDGVPTLDMEGNTRPQGASMDMGAYEFASAGGAGPDPTSQIVTIQGTITGLLDEVFENNPRNRRKALNKKLDAVYSLVMAAEAEDDPARQDALYQEAINKLQHDIGAKMDGCDTNLAADANDWIIDCSGQEEAYNLIQDLIATLRP